MPVGMGREAPLSAALSQGERGEAHGLSTKEDIISGSFSPGEKAGG